MQNHSYENVLHLQVHFHAYQTRFHMKSFARRLTLRQRQSRTRKWAINFVLRQGLPFAIFLPASCMLHVSAVVQVVTNLTCTSHFQVYYHLGAYEDSLTYALGAGDLFDVNGHSEYVETIIGMAI